MQAARITANRGVPTRGGAKFRPKHGTRGQRQTSGQARHPYTKRVLPHGDPKERKNQRLFQQEPPLRDTTSERTQKVITHFTVREQKKRSDAYRQKGRQRTSQRGARRTQTGSLEPRYTTTTGRRRTHRRQRTRPSWNAAPTIGRNRSDLTTQADPRGPTRLEAHSDATTHETMDAQTCGHTPSREQHESTRRCSQRPRHCRILTTGQRHHSANGCSIRRSNHGGRAQDADNHG